MVNNSNKTHFGFQEVDTDKKAGKVADVFNSVTDKYDLMNDLMSLGLHRLWKRFAINICNLSKGKRVLDLAGGTGDLAIEHAKAVGEKGVVILSDINQSMLSAGRDKTIDIGVIKPIECCLVNAEKIPFANNYFDCVTIGFGLRNVTDKEKALSEIFRVLRPGGKLVILEFSHLTVELLQPIYDYYSFRIIPAIGEMVANDKDSYNYLSESIRVHPDQETLKSMMESNGFQMCDYFNLSGGIVAIHKGYKI